MSFLGLFGGKRKTNLQPDIPRPVQSDLYFTSPDATSGGYNLRDFAKKRIRGEGLGFGSDYTDRMANPAIAQLENSFQKSTLPTISSEASKRGLGRSSLVTSQIGEAERQKNLDVNSLVSQFYNLNKMQEKKDLSEGLGLAQDLQNQENSMLQDRAAASERTRDLTASRAASYDQQDQTMRDRFLQAAGGISTNFFGSAAGQGLLNRFGLNNMVLPNQTRANIIGNFSDDDLGRMIMERQMRRNMGML